MSKREAQIAKSGNLMGKGDWRRGCATPAKSGLLPEWELAPRNQHGSDPATNAATITMSKADHGTLYNIIDDLRDGVAVLVASRDAALRLAEERAVVVEAARRLCDVGWGDDGRLWETRNELRDALAALGAASPAGEATPMKTNVRDLALAFFQLTYSQKQAVAEKLGLIDNEVADLPDLDRHKRIFIRARERGLLEELDRAMRALEVADEATGRAEGDHHANP